MQLVQPRPVIPAQPVFPTPVLPVQPKPVVPVQPIAPAWPVVPAPQVPTQKILVKEPQPVVPVQPKPVVHVQPAVPVRPIVPEASGSQQKSKVKIHVKHLKNGVGDKKMDPFVMVFYGPGESRKNLVGRTEIVPNGGANAVFDEELEVDFNPGYTLFFSVKDVDLEAVQHDETDSVGRTAGLTIESLPRDAHGGWYGPLPLTRKDKPGPRGDLIVYIHPVPVASRVRVAI